MTPAAGASASVVFRLVSSGYHRDQRRRHGATARSGPILRECFPQHITRCRFDVSPTRAVHLHSQHGALSALTPAYHPSALSGVATPPTSKEMLVEDCYPDQARLCALLYQGSLVRSCACLFTGIAGPSSPRWRHSTSSMVRSMAGLAHPLWEPPDAHPVCGSIQAILPCPYGWESSCLGIDGTASRGFDADEVAAPRGRHPGAHCRCTGGRSSL